MHRLHEARLSHESCDEIIIEGAPLAIVARLMELTLDGWINYLSYGCCRLGCADYDEIKVHLLRPKIGKCLLPDTELVGREV